MALELSSVSITRGKKQVVHDLSFSVNKPELIGIIGPNGAGKSSLMRAIAGLLPFSGSIWLDNISMTTLRAEKIARRLAYLPQERVVHWPLTVKEVVMLGRIPHRKAFGSASRDDIKAVDEAMRHLEISKLANRSFSTLSGGEQARVLIARMAAQETQLIIADEPTSGLDPSHQIGLMQLFQTFVASGKTVLTSLHDLPLSSRWCDRILLIKEGRVVADGAPDAVMTVERIAEVYGVQAVKSTVNGRPLIVPTDIIS
jgi:iron complex transport system ATP-binding protein